MIWARCTGVMGVPMKWEIARIFVVGTGGSGFCAEAAPSGVIGFFMAVAPWYFAVQIVGSSWNSTSGKKPFVTSNPLGLSQDHFFLTPAALACQPAGKRRLSENKKSGDFEHQEATGASAT